eukprot:TRINITY_DN13430_c0_g1_i1.p1 TRINITY_DN13430_c0_g1~~TRINITY_DN13430_c0_g1_i1.p1  ORF type:complete len:330 (-),score=86.05 TRINITY_DN13430_c0_g1_i1:389-1378(-)
MAAPIVAAAALGFLGSKATGFVNTQAAGQTSAATIRAHGHVASVPVQQAAESSNAGSALCAGVTVGIVGAVTASSVRAKGRAARAAGFDPTGQLGAMQPVGYWDPVGMMKVRSDKDGFEWKGEETFKNYRIAELKHGRVAMMAMVGMFTTTVWKFPGFQNVPDGLAAFDTEKGASGFGIIFILASYFEMKYPTGDFDIPGPWGAIDELRTKELANGRLAMAAAITMLLTEYGDALKPSEQLASCLSVSLQSTFGFSAAWAAFALLFLWTQPRAVEELDWSYKNALWSKGLGEKPAPLAEPVPVTLSASLPQSATESKIEETPSEVVAES